MAITGDKFVIWNVKPELRTILRTLEIEKLLKGTNHSQK